MSVTDERSAHLYTKAFHYMKFDCDLNSSSLTNTAYVPVRVVLMVVYTKKANCDRSKLFELQLHGSCLNIQKQWQCALVEIAQRVKWPVH